MYKKIKRNEEAVSPVLGVILMVVITVIIAAVIAAFVFGIGAPTKAPAASLRVSTLCETCNAAGVGLVIDHQGGDPIVFTNSQVLIDPNANDASIAEESLGQLTESANIGSTTTFDPGEQTVVYGTFTGTITAGNTAEVKVVDTQTGKLILDTKVVITA